MIFGNLTSPKFVEVKKEFLNANSFHDHCSLQTLFNIERIICGIYSLLLESVVDDIQGLSGIRVERGPSISELPVSKNDFLLGSFGHVFWKDVLRLVNIGTKLKVVDFSDICLVEVLSQKQLVELLRRRYQLELLQHSSELLRCHMTVLGPVVVLELRLNQDTFVNDLILDCAQ